MYYNNKKLILSIFWMILGAVLLGLSVTEVLDSSMYAGMGGALIAVGALQLARNLRYRKDPEYREKIDTEANDERNSFLRMKSWSWTGYVVVLVEGVGSIAAMILGKRELQLTLACSVWLIMVVYWISFFIISKKY